jgi:GT2 family glycosyltransferase/SAM-dependent methyltransferase
MSDQYNKYYYQTHCGLPYERTEHWLAFFGGIADHIVEDIDPETVLDAGCAMGFLVEALRDRGAEAYGIDISEYAIGEVREDIKKFCKVGSILDPLERQYDLIITIEVMEHLTPEEGKKAIENLCRYTDDILFTSTPYDFKEATHQNVQPPEYWAEIFARNGFIRDIDYDAGYITEHAMRFVRTRKKMPAIVRDYERKNYVCSLENKKLRELSLEMRDALSQQYTTIERLTIDNERLKKEEGLKPGLEQEIARLKTEISGKSEENYNLTQQMLDLNRRVNELRIELDSMRRSIVWKFTTMFHTKVIEKLLPISSKRRETYDLFLKGGRILVNEGWNSFWMSYRAYRWSKGRFVDNTSFLNNIYESDISLSDSLRCTYEELRLIRDRVKSVRKHTESVDIIICIHNALSDVRKCLDSVIRYTSPPYSLILVDDGSNMETASYLNNFSQLFGTRLIRNNEPRGYTFAANQGMRDSNSDYIVLLNSDTIVTPEWLDRMVECASTDEKTGMVGPLSNTASWQSVPEIQSNGDWHNNPLPPGVSVPQMGRLVAKVSKRQYPKIPFLNGFCLLVKRDLIEEIGYFDEESFGRGYGEENDYCLRALKAGWELRVADDVYIFHAQSRSYTDELRKELVKKSDKVLLEKHGLTDVYDGVAGCKHNRVLEGIRARIQSEFNRRILVESGKKQWEGKRILFVLPVTEPGGGAYVIIQECKALIEMGIDARILNYPKNKKAFEKNFPDLGVPVIYENMSEIGSIAAEFDACIGTVNTTVEKLKTIEQTNGKPVMGYYIQDFEPYFYSSGSIDYLKAIESYTLIPSVCRVTKTQWNRDLLYSIVGVDCTIIGPSVDIDQFRPYAKQSRLVNDTITIGALIRPSTPRRNPLFTLEVLGEIQEIYGSRVKIVTFGCTSDELDALEKPKNLTLTHMSVIEREDMPALFNAFDIFVDFSSYQAMGLTALECMACGVAVVVPCEGGAKEIVHDGVNGLIVDSSSLEASIRALRSIIEDDNLRQAISRRAIVDACNYTVEQAAYNFLTALFGQEGTYTKQEDT